MKDIEPNLSNKSAARRATASRIKHQQLSAVPGPAAIPMTTESALLPEGLWHGILIQADAILNPKKGPLFGGTYCRTEPSNTGKRYIFKTPDDHDLSQDDLKMLKVAMEHPLPRWIRCRVLMKKGIANDGTAYSYVDNVSFDGIGNVEDRNSISQRCSPSATTATDRRPPDRSPTTPAATNATEGTVR